MIFIKNICQNCFGNIRWVDNSVAFLIIIISLFYFSGLSRVPFHPDESTQIFMSSDVELFLENPRLLFWSSANAPSLQQHYREIDAPITRYLIGFGRLISGNPQLSSDWNWSNTFEENSSSGALPDPQLLLVSRISISFLFPLMLSLIYLITKYISDSFTGLISLIIFGLNSLILLHTRRAMSEGPLLFFIILFIWIIIKYPKSLILSSVVLALAINSKQSAIFLIPIGILQIFQDFGSNSSVLRKSMNAILFLMIILFVTFILNPFMWSTPIYAAISAINERSGLISSQTSAILLVSPEHVLRNATSRIAGLLGNLFLSSPAIEDIANYQSALRLSTINYLNNPLNHLFTGFLSGIMLFISCIFGICITILRQTKPKIKYIFPHWVFLLSTFSGVIFLLFFVPLYFQRYVIILMPFIAIYSSIGICSVATMIKMAYKSCSPSTNII